MTEFVWTLADGRRIAGLRWGAGPRHFIALHGWLDNAASFAPLAKYLPLDVTLHAVDLPGHGYSDHAPVGSFYHFSDWLLDLDWILDVAPMPIAGVIGHSMGAAIASMFAGVRPERIPALLLVEGLGPISEAPARMPERMARHMDERRQWLAKAERLYPSFETVLAARLKAAPMPEATARAVLERSMEHAPEGWRWRSDARLKIGSPVRLTEEHVRATLSRIACPTTLVMAASPRYIEDPELRTRADSVRNLAVHRIAGGHHLHAEHPERIAQLLA